MKRFILFIIFITGLHVTTVAQVVEQKVDSLIAELAKSKPDTNKVQLLNEISGIYFQQNPELSRQYGEKVLSLATELKYDFGIFRGNNLIGRCYAVQNNLPLALKYFQAALEMARKLKNAKYEGIMLSSISAVYTQNGDYNKALEYAMSAKSINEKAGIKYMVNLMINIGYLYSVQGKLREALEAYAEGMRQEEAYGTEQTNDELANLYLNVGTTYVRMGEYASSLQYFYKAKPILERLGHTKNLGICMDDIGAAYLGLIIQNKNNGRLPDSLNDINSLYDKTEYYLLQASSISEKLEIHDIAADADSNLSSLYGFKHNYEKAYEYFKKFIVHRDILKDVGRQKEFAKVEAEFAVRKKTDSLKYQNALKDKEIREKNLERNGGIALISLAGIISLLMINRQKLKHQQRSLMAEKETKRVTELAKQQLDDFTKSIQEKNELIEKFSAEIEKYQALPCSNDLPDKENSLQLLQNSVILTEDQWVSFQHLFDKVHTGYINRVKDKFADLTAAELRFTILTKMGLNNKEMAAMLGVSPEAVRVSKHRLLKKIHLPEGVSLDEVVQSL